MDQRMYFMNGRGMKAVDLWGTEGWTISGAPLTGDSGLWRVSPWAYRALNLTADLAASVPFALVDRAGNDVDISTAWANKIGWLVNPRALIRKTVLSLFLTGTGYWQAGSKTRIGTTAGARYLSPWTMTPEYDKATGELKEFTRTIKSGPQTFTPDEIVYFWEDDATIEIGPPTTCRYTAMLLAVKLLQSQDQFALDFLSSGGVLPTMIMVKGMPNQSDREKLERIWDKFVKGWRNVSGKIFDAESLDIKTVGQGVDALKDAALTEAKRQDIAVVSGMPYSLLATDAANYATAQVYRMLAYENEAIPQAEFIFSVLNEQRLEAQGYRLEARPEQLDAMQQDDNNAASAYTSLVGAGMRPSIAAQIVGLDMPAGTEYEDLDTEPPAEPTQAEPPAEPVKFVETVTAMPAIQPLPPLTPEALRELDIWKRKAQKAMKRGEAPLFPFACHHLPNEYQEHIKAALTEALTEAAVHDAFVFGEPLAQDDGVKAVLEAIRLGVEALKINQSDTTE